MFRCVALERCQWHLRGRPPQIIVVVWAVLRRRLQRWLYVACDDRLGWVAGELFVLVPSHIIHVVFVLSALLVHSSVEKGSIECQGVESMSIEWLGSTPFPSISAGSLIGLR